jgi:hypothetical protein
MAENGIQVKEDPKHSGIETGLDLVMFDFGGVNLESPRQRIGENDLYWAENVVPSAPGYMRVANQVTLTGISIATVTVVFEVGANIANVDYIFAFFSDGSARQIMVGSSGSGTLVAAAGTFTTPRAIPWGPPNSGNTGVLVIDPVNGYFDIGVTTTGVTTPLGNSATSVTLVPGTAPTFATTTLTRVTFSGAGAGTGAVVGTECTTVSVAISTAGTGYAVGDRLQASTATGAVVVAVVLTVTSVGSGGAGGNITGITITTAGVYMGPTSSSGPSDVGPSGATVTTGAGTGAVLTYQMILTSYILQATGSGYTAPFTASFDLFIHGAWFGFGQGNITVSGSLVGNAIATYAGRIWIATGKAISYTDIDAYNFFGGAGGQLTIADSYLHNNITALFSAFGFLYIFGDTMVDVLSNVQVNSGVTSFSRTNLTTSIGTTFPNSIFGYYRQLVFANAFGFYALSGASPEKISDSLDGLFTSSVFVGGALYGCSVSIEGKLAKAWMLRIVDRFTTLYGTNVTRTIIVCQLRNKWFFYYPGFDIASMVEIPTNGVPTIYAFTATAPSNLYTFFTLTEAATLSYWQTKLWDGSMTMLSKESIKVMIEMTFGPNVVTPASPAITVDNENGLYTIANLKPAGAGFNYLKGNPQTSGGRYIGMSVKGLLTDVTYSAIGLQFRETTPWP